jgi:hypothetical protein
MSAFAYRGCCGGPSKSPPGSPSMTKSRRHCRARMARATRSVYSLKRLSAGLSNLGSERKSTTMLRRTLRQQCCDAANVRPFGLVGEAEAAKRSYAAGTTTTPMPTMAAAGHERLPAALGSRRRAEASGDLHQSQRASHRAAFGMPGRAGKARSAAGKAPATCLLGRVEAVVRRRAFADLCR